MAEPPLPAPVEVRPAVMVRQASMSAPTRCLAEWVDKVEEYPTLATMAVPGSRIVLQLIEFSMMGDKPTGEVVFMDGEFTVPAMLGEPGSDQHKKYRDYLVNGRLNKYALVTVLESAGPPENLVIVSFFSIFIYILLFRCSNLPPAEDGQSRSHAAQESCGGARAALHTDLQPR